VLHLNVLQVPCIEPDQVLFKVLLVFQVASNKAFQFFEHLGVILIKQIFDLSISSFTPLLKIVQVSLVYELEYLLDELWRQLRIFFVFTVAADVLAGEVKENLLLHLPALLVLFLLQQVEQVDLVVNKLLPEVFQELLLHLAHYLQPLFRAGLKEFVAAHVRLILDLCVL